MSTRRRILPALTLAVVLAGGCGGEASSPATTTGATTTQPGRLTAGAAGDCPMRMPDEIVPEVEAVVQFDVDRVCPGFLRIAPGTTVTFRNDGAKRAEVTVKVGDGDAAPTVFESPVEAGASVTVDMDESGAYRYYVTALPDFMGMIEVLSG